MAFGSLSPVAAQQFFDGNGDPLAGGQLAFFLAGSSTPTPAYADFALTTPLPNPVILDAAGRAPALFLDALSYKQTLSDAAGVQIWSVDNIPTPTALRSASDILTLTGLQHNVPVPSGLISFLHFTNNSPVQITGFAGGVPGQILILRAGQYGAVELLHMQGSGYGNQLYNFAQSGPTALAGVHGTAVYIYQTPVWILLTHEQGQAIRVPYHPGNFYPSGGTAAAWTVDAADVIAQDYLLSGSQLTITVTLRNTAVVGGPGFLVVGGFPYTILGTGTALPALSEYGTGPFESVGIGPASFAPFNWLAFSRANGQPWLDGAGVVHLFAQLSVGVQ